MLHISRSCWDCFGPRRSRLPSTVRLGQELAMSCTSRSPTRSSHCPRNSDLRIFHRVSGFRQQGQTESRGRERLKSRAAPTLDSQRGEREGEEEGVVARATEHLRDSDSAVDGCGPVSSS